MSKIKNTPGPWRVGGFGIILYWEKETTSWEPVPLTKENTLLQASAPTLYAENAKLREVVKLQNEQLENNIVFLTFVGFHIDSDAVVKTNEAILKGKEVLK